MTGKGEKADAAHDKTAPKTDARKQRLAEALRQNLGKRKAQSRSRRPAKE
jgi:hypothetical protein